MLVIGGDSFSATTEHRVWHDFIQYNSRKKINLAWHGAGNFYIADSIQQMVKANHSIIKKVIVFWSEHHRLDLLVKKPFNSFHKKNASGCWQFSGGIDNGTTEWKKVFKNTIKSKGYDNIVKESINQVNETLHLLDAHEVDFNFGFIFPDEQNKIFYQHKKFIPLVFSQWVAERNLQGPDGCHPSEEGHRLFSEEIQNYLDE
tara:strand:+ start:87 stop:692 length:606 start_codon:yes stop_codon:yes gene_type:complete